MWLGISYPWLLSGRCYRLFEGLVGGGGCCSGLAPLKPPYVGTSDVPTPLALEVGR